MKLINFGSLNIDKVYSVKHTVREGETITAASYNTFTGGKGLNQSVAASRAGMKVLHAGALGPDGSFLKDYLKSADVDVSCLLESKEDTGHAIIQVNEEGQNSIIVFSGANRNLTKSYIDLIIKEADKDDIVLLQNETNNVDYIINKAHDKGLVIAWNPSPVSDSLKDVPSSFVDIFFVNEIEGAALSGIKSDDFEEILMALASKYPKATVVLTLGSQGVMCISGGVVSKHSAYNVKVADTTAAGDTFTGYYLYCYSKGFDVDKCLEIASAASAIAVSRKGAAPSIPTMDEVLEFIK